MEIKSIQVYLTAHNRINFQQLLFDIASKIVVYNHIIACINVNYEDKKKLFYEQGCGVNSQGVWVIFWTSGFMSPIGGRLQLWVNFKFVECILLSKQEFALNEKYSISKRKFFLCILNAFIFLCTCSVLKRQLIEQ